MPATPIFATAIADMHTAMVSMLANATATFDRVDLDGEAIPVMFTAPSDVSVVGGYGVQVLNPVATIRTANVPSSPVNTPVLIDGVRYLVAEHNKLGTGISRLILERAP